VRIVDEIRIVQVLPALWDLPFPHARQVLLIERHTRDPHGNRLSDRARHHHQCAATPIATLRTPGRKNIAAGLRRAASG
jgi:hypothetical protein